LIKHALADYLQINSRIYDELLAATLPNFQIFIIFDNTVFLDLLLIFFTYLRNLSIFFMAGTIGDLSDGESLSGQDNESLQDPSKKSHKRSMRKTAREDFNSSHKSNSPHIKKR
jgi:hypothetical protein